MSPGACFLANLLFSADLAKHLAFQVPTRRRFSGRREADVPRGGQNCTLGHKKTPSACGPAPAFVLDRTRKNTPELP